MYRIRERAICCLPQGCTIGPLATTRRMEQLNDPILEFEAFARTDGGDIAPFVLKVWGPERQDAGEYLCKIHCPYFGKGPFSIFGVDEDQACEEVTVFVERMLDGRAVLVDKNGDNVDVPTVAWC